MGRDRHSSDEPEVKVFSSAAERDRWQMQQYGRLKYGFREPDDPASQWGDNRPPIARAQFWTDESERLTYENAVETHRRRADEGAGSYIIRVAESVEGKLAQAGKAMPRPMSRAQRDERLAKLREQARAEEARLPYKESA